MESRKYSVIIPAYNAEKTIERCLDSILCYDRDDIEILIINDGSSDRTEEICKSYSSSEDRIRYYYKPNGGVSSARNMGLSLAKGIYILFVDSDDFLCGDVFSLADREMEQGVEWLVYSAESKTIGMNDGSPLRMMDGGKVADKLSELLKKQMLNAVISKVFLRNIICENGMRFDERLDIGEDKVFVLQYITKISSATVCSECYYGISTENNESLSRKKREKLAESILLEHKLLFSAIEDSKLLPEYKRKYKRAVSYSYHRSAYTVVGELRKFDLSRKERLAKTREILEKYSMRKDYLLYNGMHFLMAIPVRLKMAGIIDLLISLRERAGAFS